MSTTSSTAVLFVARAARTAFAVAAFAIVCAAPPLTSTSTCSDASRIGCSAPCTCSTGGRQIGGTTGAATGCETGGEIGGEGCANASVAHAQAMANAATANAARTARPTKTEVDEVADMQSSLAAAARPIWAWNAPRVPTG